MADYPTNVAVPTFIHTWTFYMNATVFRTIGAIGTPGAVTWTSGQAVYCPLFLPWPYYVARAFWWNNSTIAGNSDIGIYSVGGSQLWHSGSTANSGASVPQFATASMLLPAGRYFLGFSSTTTTTGITGAAVNAITGRIMGLYTQASAEPLPATATFAAYAAVGLPLMGVTSTTTGF